MQTNDITYFSDTFQRIQRKSLKYIARINYVIELLSHVYGCLSISVKIGCSKISERKKLKSTLTKPSYRNTCLSSPSFPLISIIIIIIAINRTLQNHEASDAKRQAADARRQAGARC